MKYLREIAPDRLRGKRCLVRLNLDVAHYSYRIPAAVPTLRFLLERGVNITIVSHRGRPQGPDPTLSIKPEVEMLFRELGQSLPWLENVRFDPREQENDETFAQELAAKADFFVNDDFAVSHHRGASFLAITKFLPSYAGLLLEKEVTTLTRVMRAPEQPLVVILGGVKADDKLMVLDYFADKADAILLGSAYIDRGVAAKPNTIVPEDWLAGSQGEKFDIGPKTVDRFSSIIKNAKMVVWAGPLGKFEDEQYREGSKKVAEAVAASGAFSVVGGGDTTEMLSLFGFADKFSFVSTGGGAMLEFLAGKTLPAIAALEENTLSL